VLPPGFVRIRHFGFFAHRRRRDLLPLCFHLMAAAVTPAPEPSIPTPLWRCPHCGGFMKVLERLSPVQARFRAPPTSTHNR
jgi:hypothetical protein